MDFSIHSITKNAEETEKIGEELGASYLNEQGTLPPRIILCFGDLGSGKTTFVRGIARGLGINTRLLSPTYIIVRRYDISKLPHKSFLYHLDLYRIENSQEVKSIGIQEMIHDSQSITVIEWPDRLKDIAIKLPVLEAHFRALSDDRHECHIEMKDAYESNR